MKNWTHPSWCLSIFLLSHLNNINSFALNLMEPSIDGKIRKWRRTFSLKMGEQPKDFAIFLTNHHSIFFRNLPEFSRKTLRFLVAYQVEYSILLKICVTCSNELSEIFQNLAALLSWAKKPFVIAFFPVNWLLFHDKEN